MVVALEAEARALTPRKLRLGLIEDLDGGVRVHVCGMGIAAASAAALALAESGVAALVMVGVAGALDPGDKVVVTEDTVTRGTSLLEAAHAVQEAGAEVVLLVAVVDRGGTAEAMAAAEGLTFKAILTAKDLGFDYEGA